MSPENAICDIVTQVFPGSSCRTWREAAKDYQHFEFRLVAGARVWGLEHVIPGEIVDAHPEAAAREIVQEIRARMDKEMRPGRIEQIYQGAQAADPWPGEYVYTSPFTGAPMAKTGFGRDGWFDTDQRRRDNQRLLELARIETERQEEEKAKASILDSIVARERKGRRTNST